MCKCISLLQSEAEWVGKLKEEVKSPEMEDWVFAEIAGVIKMASATRISYATPRGKKRKVILVAHTFCPFCGERQAPEGVPVISNIDQ